MDSSTIIQYVLVTLFSIGITALINHYFNKSKVQQQGDLTILVMPKLYLYLFPLLLVFGSFFEYMAFFYEEEVIHFNLKIIYAGFGAFIIINGFGSLLLFIKHKTKYNHETIEVISWLGKENTIQWKDIEKVSFLPLSSSMKIKTMDKCLRVHEHIKGFKEFTNLIEEKSGLVYKRVYKR